MSRPSAFLSQRYFREIARQINDERCRASSSRFACFAVRVLFRLCAAAAAAAAALRQVGTPVRDAREHRRGPTSGRIEENWPHGARRRECFDDGYNCRVLRAQIPSGLTDYQIQTWTRRAEVDDQWLVFLYNISKRGFSSNFRIWFLNSLVMVLIICGLMIYKSWFMRKFLEIASSLLPTSLQNYSSIKIEREWYEF